MNDAGETVAQINSRSDDRSWPDVLSALQDGAELHRPVGLRDYYTQGLGPMDRRNGRKLHAARVRKLEKSGVLQRIGVDTYGLAPTGFSS